jgi:CDP-glucose 4,6-dehydratase
VLVTGHSGFKGSWLSLWLQLLGAEVTGFALEPPTDPSIFVDARVATGMSSIVGDVRQLESLSTAISEHRPEIVFHLAAQSLVRRSYSEPVSTLSTNVMGAVNLLEAIRLDPTPRVVVVVTSDKCYENREWYWGYREHERLGGRDPYSASKACVEIVTRSLRESFFPPGSGVAIASARAGNVIGGGDWADDRLVPDIIRALSEGRNPTVRLPQATRPWQHVLEPLSGYLVLAERLLEEGDSFAEAWNFGPDDRDAKPVSWIVERISALWDAPGTWELQPGDHPHEATYLKLDASKAHERLGWRPRLGVERALEWIVEWYRAYDNGSDVRAVAEDQICRYAEISTL